MNESFRPVSNTAPIGLRGKAKFYGRMVPDLQILTIYRDLRKILPRLSGSILDVGCGESPYRFLLNGNQSVYRGIDVVRAAAFGYHNRDVIPFDGIRIPFRDGAFDAFLCTEVLEHVEDYGLLIAELHRVLKPGAKGIVTVPWSARFHYKPYDYFRYTPSALASMFAAFGDVSIRPRGTDVSAIAAKIIVLFVRNLRPIRPINWVLLPLWALLSPLCFIALLAGQAGVWLGIGSADDPLGYTVELTK